MTINFNISPYYDDFEEAKKFLRIMFQPGRPVQTRELNQLQTILQNQVSRLGDSFFKQGDVVIPGEASVDTSLAYVKVDSEFQSVPVESYLDDIVGSTITGETSGVSAKVVAVSKTEGTDPITIFLKYSSSGTDNVTKTFQNGEDLVTDGETISGNVRRFTVQVSDAVGVGSAAFIARGVYYVRNCFALVEEQILILDKYSNTPSYRVGLVITEDFVTSQQDESLNDNATGTYNFSAPGADRYRITLTLAKKEFGEIDGDDFVEIVRIRDGVLEKAVINTEYSVLERALAERTFDESGNYTVSAFPVQVREHRNNNQGVWTSGKSVLVGDVVRNGSGLTYVANNSGITGVTEPTGTGSPSDGVITWSYNAEPFYNQGVYVDGDEAKLAIGVEAGKAYIQGYKIEKIATEYIDIPKAREFERVNADQIPTNWGGYLLVNGINGVVDISTFATVSLYDQLTTGGSIVGTAKIRGLKFESGTIGTATAVYRLYVYDVVMNAGKTIERHVKRLQGTGFYANTLGLQSGEFQITGSVTASDTAVTGYGTRFTQEFVVGDYIIVPAGTARVTAIASDVAMTIGSSLTQTTQVVAYVHNTRVLEIAESGLIFPVGQYATRKIRAADDLTVDTIYYTTQKFSGTAVGGSLTISLGSALDGSTVGTSFDESALKNDFIVINQSTGSIVDPATVVVGPTSVTITGLSNVVHFVYAPVLKSGNQAKEKTKTLVLNHSVDKTVSGDAIASEIPLGKADVIRLRSVMMATGFGAYNATGAVDITERFIFNNGQTDDHYGIAKLVRVPGNPAPTGSLRIVFDYYNHSAGDYFSVDSYPNYADIPDYTGSKGTISLRDVLDFRPRVADSGTGYAGGITQPPRIGSPTIADYSYYLARKDKISMDLRGELIHSQGTSGLIPVLPEDPKNAMVLYHLSLPPYTVSAGEVTINKIDNKRYTMRDIGKLEKRIDNLEYYTTLSLLEQETSSMLIPDEFGLNRFKNGFIVDSFKGHGIGNVFSIDYRCAIDMENKVLRPATDVTSVQIVDKFAANSNRLAEGYVMTGDIVTLPYTHLVAIDQPFASRTENVNPFAVYTFVGAVELNPPSDDWFEINRQPDIVNNVAGNFDSVVAQVGGLTSTVWNGWQTQWSGVTTSRTGWTFDAWDRGVRRWKRSATTTITQDQTRTGTQFDVIERVDRELVEDRILSTAVIPFMRSRSLSFVARSLKPNTRMYPYFENVKIDNWITPAAGLVFSPVTSYPSQFDTESNVGGLTEEAAREFNGNVELGFNHGDVVFVKTRGVTTYNKNNSVATGIAILQEEVNATSLMEKKIHIVNVKGTFQAGDIVEGSISGARGSVVSYSAASVGGALVTNKNGAVAGSYVIPNTDEVRFRTGVRKFTLTDSENYGEFTTIGSAQYRAQGVIETRQNTFNSVRNADVVATSVSQNQTVVTSATVREVTWYDPLAQTFMIQQSGGAFLTKCDIYFSTKDANIPVTLEIREVVNGYPGQVVLPFSKVSLTPDQVSVDPVSGTAATTFTFKSPVFINSNVEYAIVLVSDSNNYRVWISQLGEPDVITGSVISTQPYLGTLFKSQNASTWTPDQTQDLKFKLYRASFNTSVGGYVRMVNQKLPTIELAYNPFKTFSGSNVVRVFQRGHGFTPGSKVTISGVVGTNNGVDAAQFNKQHTVVKTAWDSYTIQLAVNATVTGFCGNTGVRATTNAMYDVIQPQIQTMVLPDTSLSLRAITTSGKSLAGSEIPYVVSGTQIRMIQNENNYLNAPALIASAENEPLDGLNNPIKTLEMVAEIRSTNEAISPVIDMTRNSVVLINNLVDRASSADNQSPETDYFVAETAPQGSSSASKYIIRQIDLSSESTFLDIKFAASVPTVADIEVYYKVAGAGSSLATKDFTQINTGSAIVKSGSGEFRDVELKIANLEPFTSVVVKIVMKSSSSANVPLIKDLRIIACV